MPTLETPPNPAPPSAPKPPVRLVTRRFGELEEHELLHLIDTLDAIDDEIAKARFRESIYISVIICLALAWFAFYGPRFLFHQGRIANRPVDVAKINPNEMKFLDLPKNLVHKPPPKTKIVSDQDRVSQTPHPVPKPEPPKARPNPPAQPLPNAPQPQPARAQPQQPVQQAQPAPQPRPRPQPQNSQLASIPDAPAPSNAAHPSFNAGSSAPGQSTRDLANSLARGGGGNYGSGGVSHNGPQGDVEILSDTLGVDFGPYIKHLLRMLYESWVPLIPEETRPPLNKEGSTLIRFTINPDGSLAVGGMHLDASTHDEAIDRAAWGSITGVGQFPPLPKNFTGPNLQLRIHFIIARNAPKNDF